MVASIGLSCKQLAENGPNVEPKFFVSLGSTLQVNNITTTDYLFLFHGKLGCFNYILISLSATFRLNIEETESHLQR